MINTVSFNISDKAKAELAFSIRQKVFVDEQKVSRDEEYDAYEEIATHYLAMFEGTPAGTARWRVTDHGVKLERFAVLPDFRNHGVGSVLVNTVLQHVLPLNKKIYLHSQVSAMNLYAKAGFVPEGELFYEANIPHYKMVYKGL
jgi:predicted GNAT family N-acyltransferase